MNTTKNTKKKYTFKNGFEFEYDERIFNDWRFSEPYGIIIDPESDLGDVNVAVIKLVNFIFGDKKQEMLDSLKDKDGFIPADGPSQMIWELMNSSDDKTAKNS